MVVFDELEFSYLYRALSQKRGGKTFTRKYGLYDLYISLAISHHYVHRAIVVELEGCIEDNDVRLSWVIEEDDLKRRNPRNPTFICNGEVYHPFFLYLSDRLPDGSMREGSELSMCFIEDITHLNNSCTKCLAFLFDKIFSLIDEYVETHPDE